VEEKQDIRNAVVNVIHERDENNFLLIEFFSNNKIMCIFIMSHVEFESDKKILYEHIGDVGYLIKSNMLNDISFVVRQTVTKGYAKIDSRLFHRNLKCVIWDMGDDETHTKFSLDISKSISNSKCFIDKPDAYYGNFTQEKGLEYKTRKPLCILFFSRNPNDWVIYGALSLTSFDLILEKNNNTSFEVICVY
jgi:hypothetical protein